MARVPRSLREELIVFESLVSDAARVTFHSGSESDDVVQGGGSWTAKLADLRPVTLWLAAQAHRRRPNFKIERNWCDFLAHFFELMQQYPALEPRSAIPLAILRIFFFFWWWYKSRIATSCDHDHGFLKSLTGSTLFVALERKNCILLPRPSTMTLSCALAMRTDPLTTQLCAASLVTVFHGKRLTANQLDTERVALNECCQVQCWVGQETQSRRMNGVGRSRDAPQGSTTGISFFRW